MCEGGKREEGGGGTVQQRGVQGNHRKRWPPLHPGPPQVPVLIYISSVADPKAKFRIRIRRKFSFGPGRKIRIHPDPQHCILVLVVPINSHFNTELLNCKVFDEILILELGSVATTLEAKPGT